MNLAIRAGLLSCLILVTTSFINAQERILFVGNSFTYGHTNPVKSYNRLAITDSNGSDYGGVPGIFKRFTTQAGLDYDVTIEAVSSADLDYHLTNKSEVLSQNWDIVVLQEQSTKPLADSHGGDTGEFITCADNIADLVLANNPSARLILYETWASPNSMSKNGYGSSLQAMQDDLKYGYFWAYYRSVRSAGYKADYSAVFRVGDAFMHAIDLGYVDPNPWDGISEDLIYLWNTRDNRHASESGSFLAAAVMFGQLTGQDPRSIAVGTGSVAEGLGIPSEHATQLLQVAYETLSFEIPEPLPNPTINTLIAGLSPYNWNNAANWSMGALDEKNSILINESSPDNCIVANSTQGQPVLSVRTVSFDIGSETKSVQANSTVTNTRRLNLSSGVDAFGGSDLIHLSSTTTGTVYFGTKSDLGILQITPANTGSINVENALATLHFGPAAKIIGKVSLIKLGPGTLTLEAANTFGAGSEDTFIIDDGLVLAETPTSGTDSATGRSGILVAASGVLGGSGQITPGTGKSILVDSGGTLAPGSDVPGTLTLNGSLTTDTLLTFASGAHLEFDFTYDEPDGDSQDTLAITSAGSDDIVFNNNQIDFNVPSTSFLSDGDYPLIVADSIDAFSGLTVDTDGVITSGLLVGSGLDDYSAELIVSDGSIILRLALLPFSQWRGLVFSPEELTDPDISGPMATPAHDGIANLLKYALDLDPHTATNMKLPTSSWTESGDTTLLLFSYLRVINATDITYTVEVSDDLENWFSGASFTTDVTEPNDDGLTESVTTTISDEYPFARLNISLN